MYKLAHPRTTVFAYLMHDQLSIQRPYIVLVTDGHLPGFFKHEQLENLALFLLA